MKYIFKCRRTFVSILGMSALTFLGFTKGADVATSVAAIAVGLAGANAYQGRKSNEV